MKNSIISLVVFICCFALMVSFTPAQASFDGEWSGTTNQEHSFSFTVSNNRVTKVYFKLEIEGLYCNTTKSGTVHFSPGGLISDGGFSSLTL